MLRLEEFPLSLGQQANTFRNILAFVLIETGTHQHRPVAEHFTAPNEDMNGEPKQFII